MLKLMDSSRSALVAFAFIGATASLLLPGTTHAQEAGSEAAGEDITEELTSIDGIKMELNKLEEQGGGCRIYMLFENPTDFAFTELQLDLMLFNNDGVVAKRLAIDGAPLRSSKTTVKLFDVEGLPCPDIGRILLNDVMGCDTDSGPRDDCIGLIELDSRTEVDFIK